MNKLKPTDDGITRCLKCGAAPLGNCGFYDCETPRDTCPLERSTPLQPLGGSEQREKKITDGKRKHFSALEVDMADFLKSLVKHYDDRFSEGFERDETEKWVYDHADALIYRFDKIANDIGRLS